MLVHLLAGGKQAPMAHHLGVKLLVGVKATPPEGMSNYISSICALAIKCELEAGDVETLAVRRDHARSCARLAQRDAIARAE